MRNQIRFDQTVDFAAQKVRDVIKLQTAKVLLVRDMAGRITVIIPEEYFPKVDIAEKLRNELHSALGAYSPGQDSILMNESDLSDVGDFSQSEDRIDLQEHPGFALIDRLITNQDWLRAPLQINLQVPTIAFYSIKGGVGRSTALAVLAWYLAKKGKRIIIVDLDLEAPGIGSILLDAQPDFGLVDWIVEHQADPSDGLALRDCLIKAPLSDECDGSIHVLPAFGKETREYVAKLSRCFLPTITPDGKEAGLAETLMDLLHSMVRELEDKPDVILLDTRAGLHDIGSAAISRLGAEVLLFARDEPQNWDAYRHLFAHWKNAKSVEHGMPDHDLRWKLKMVAAQTHDTTKVAKIQWAQNSYDCWGEFYDEEVSSDSSTTFDQGDIDAPHFPLYIFYSDHIRNLCLNNSGPLPAWESVYLVFREFLEGVEERLWP